MSIRVLILDVVDPQTGNGLSAEVREALAAGADEVLPVCTGVVTRSDDGAPTIVATKSRLLRHALDAAMERTLDGMLIGMLPEYSQARAVAKALRSALPETLVYAPAAAGVDPHRILGNFNRRLQAAEILPESTVAILPSALLPELIAGATPEDPQAQAQAVINTGAFAAWVTGGGGQRRCVDVVAYGGKTRVLDYPEPESPPASGTGSSTLAALLALGMPLDEAIDGAYRKAACLGNEHAAAIRR